MLRKSHCLLALILGLTAASRLAAADFSGFIQSAAGWYWGSGSLFSPMYQTVEGSVSGKIGDAAAPQGSYKAAVDVKYDPTTNSTALQMQEAWIKYSAGPFDFSVGNQIVAWSVSDGVWPSDVVNPWDYSLPVDPQRVPSPLARIVFTAGGFSLDAVVQPFWEEDILPSGSRWLSSSESALASLTHQTSLDETPALNLQSMAYGAHAKLSLDLAQGLDLGLTFHRGHTTSPSGILTTTSYPPSYYYIFAPATYAGADASLSPGENILLKTEWGYTSLNDTSFTNPSAGNGKIQGVSGIEYTLGSSQLEAEYVYNWNRGTTGDSISHQVLCILTVDADSRTEIKLAGYWDFSGNGGGLATPQISYTLADGLQVSCKAFFFFGDSSTLYGSYSGNNLGELSVKYSF